MHCTPHFENSLCYSLWLYQPATNKYWFSSFPETAGWELKKMFGSFDLLYRYSSLRKQRNAFDPLFFIFTEVSLCTQRITHEELCWLLRLQFLRFIFLPDLPDLNSRICT